MLELVTIAYIMCNCIQFGFDIYRMSQVWCYCEAQTTFDVSGINLSQKKPIVSHREVKNAKNYE